MTLTNGHRYRRVRSDLRTHKIWVASVSILLAINLVGPVSILLDTFVTQINRDHQLDLLLWFTSLLLGVRNDNICIFLLMVVGIIGADLNFLFLYQRFFVIYLSNK